MADSSWDRFCTLLIEDPVLGFRLDASGMPLGGDDLERMDEPLRLAVAAMGELEHGAIANLDEGRRVGHYWLRDPELAPDQEIAEAVRSTQERIQSFAAAVHAGDVRPHASDAPSAERFRQLLLVGIGGSALGPQLVADALATPDDPIRPYFIDNTDPDGIDRTLSELGDRLAETLILIVSKSGRTKETHNGMLEVHEALKRRRLSFGPRAIAITGEGSALHEYAREEQFLDVFPMWDWVGGRTSVTSAVGLLPAALQGIDTDAFLGGARRMDVATRVGKVRANPAAMLALAWFLAGNGRGDRDMVILPYKDRLVLLSRYLQQLVMESLGKERDLRGEIVSQGLSVYGNKGSTDQHAYVQQLLEGPDNFFATFIEVLRDREGDSLEVEPGATAGDYLTGFLLGTREALSEKGRASMTITIPEVSPMTLGALIALFERTVGLYAALIGINAYHQPGVEAGKQAAQRVLELQRRVLEVLGGPGAEALTATELAARLEAADQTLTLFHVLEHLAANGRLRVIRGTPSWTSRYALH